MIMVTGATGTIGRSLVELLVEQDVKVVAVTRSPERAALPAGCEVVGADPSRPETLIWTLGGVASLFVSPPAVGDGLGTLVSLARRGGVRRVVLLSALDVEDQADPPPAIAARHRALEDVVVGSRMEWVILRPGMFAASAVSQWAGQIRAGDVVRGPYAASTAAPVHEHDVAAAAARALLDDQMVGRRVRLTGPELLTLRRMVEIIGEVIGRPLSYAEVSAEAAKHGMTAHGLPEYLADAVLSMRERSIRLPAFVAPEMPSLLGRPARTFAEWVADHADAFR